MKMLLRGRLASDGISSIKSGWNLKLYLWTLACDLSIRFICWFSDQVANMKLMSQHATRVYWWGLNLSADSPTIQNNPKMLILCLLLCLHIPPPPSLGFKWWGCIISDRMCVICRINSSPVCAMFQNVHCAPWVRASTSCIAFMLEYAMNMMESSEHILYEHLEGKKMFSIWVKSWVWTHFWLITFILLSAKSPESGQCAWLSTTKQK